MLCSMTMTPLTHEENNFVLMFIDITRAHPHCKMRRDLWIDLPAEDPRSQDPDACGFLGRSLYGTRDGGQNFGLFVFDVMMALGFEPGVWSPCLSNDSVNNRQANVCVQKAFSETRHFGRSEELSGSLDMHRQAMERARVALAVALMCVRKRERCGVRAAPRVEDGLRVGRGASVS